MSSDAVAPRSRIALRARAHRAVDGLADDFNRPSWRAGAAAAVLVTGILGCMNARAVPTVITATMIGAAVMEGYELLEDIARGARASA